MEHGGDLADRLVSAVVIIINYNDANCIRTDAGTGESYRDYLL